MKIEFKTLENNIKIIIIGDIHLGHNNNKNNKIKNNNKKIKKKIKKIKK